METRIKKVKVYNPIEVCFILKEQKDFDLLLKVFEYVRHTSDAGSDMEKIAIDTLFVLKTAE